MSLKKETNNTFFFVEKQFRKISELSCIDMLLNYILATGPPYNSRIGQQSIPHSELPICSKHRKGGGDSKYLFQLPIALYIFIFKLHFVKSL